MKRINYFYALLLSASLVLLLSACGDNKVHDTIETSCSSDQVSTNQEVQELSLDKWVGGYKSYNVPSSTSSFMSSGLRINKDGSTSVYLDGAEIMANNQGEPLTGEVKVSKTKPDGLAREKFWGYTITQDQPIIGADTLEPIEVTPDAYITVSFEQNKVDKINQIYGDNLSDLSQTWISYSSTDGKNILTDGKETPTVLFPKIIDQTTISNKSTTKSMNFDEIERGNYSSVKGTWKNTQGDTIIITDDTIIANAFRTATGEAEAIISGLTINIPSQNDSNGNPKLIENNVFKGAPLYSKNLSVTVDRGSNSNVSFNFLSLGTNTVNAFSQIAFLPANIKPYNMEVATENDSSTEDRIFLNIAQQVSVDINNAYLKVE